MIWQITSATYIGIGLLLVFVGPAARMRRHEVEMKLFSMWSSSERALFSTGLASGIVLLWPVLVPSAWRAERAMSVPKEFKRPSPVRRERSAEVEACLAQMRDAAKREITFTELNALLTRFEGSDYQALLLGLNDLGIVVREPVLDGNSPQLSVIVAEKLGQPISLTRQIDGEALLGNVGRTVEDEIWEFTTTADSWNNLAGRAGIAVVRGGVVIGVETTVMN